MAKTTEKKYTKANNIELRKLYLKKNKKIVYRYLSFFSQVIPFFVIVFLLTLYSLTPTIPSLTQIVSNNSSISLSTRSFGKKDTYKIHGTVNFYQNKLFGEIDSFDENASHISVNLPSSIEDTFKLSDIPSTSNFYGSYVFDVEGAPVNKDLTIYIQNASIAYKVFIDNQLVSTNGSTTIERSFLTHTNKSTVTSKRITSSSFRVIIEICSDSPVLLVSNPNISTYQAYQYYNNFDRSFGLTFFGALFALIVIISLVYILSRKMLFSKYLPLLLFCIMVLLLSHSCFNGFLDSLKLSKFIVISIGVLLGQVGYIAIELMVDEIVKYKHRWIKILIQFGVSIAISTLFVFPATIKYAEILLILNSIYLVISTSIIFYKEIIKGTQNSSLCFLMSISGFLFLFVELLSLLGVLPLQESMASMVFFVLFCGLSSFVYSRQATVMYQSLINASKVEQELTETNASLLLSQIQPHFIYNTLNTIKFLIEDDPNQAEYAIVKFSQYLRANMKSMEKKNAIPFEDELNHTENYIAIEMIRFGDHMKVVSDIKVSDFFIPPLTLEPLVENAIKHGASKRIRGGKVIIESFDDNDNYYVRVTDNGQGFDTAILNQTKNNSIGLNNIKRRLKIMTNAELKIISKPGQGTISLITLPKKDNRMSIEKEEEIQIIKDSIK